MVLSNVIGRFYTEHYLLHKFLDSSWALLFIKQGIFFSRQNITPLEMPAVSSTKMEHLSYVFSIFSNFHPFDEIITTFWTCPLFGAFQRHVSWLSTTMTNFSILAYHRTILMQPQKLTKSE